MSGHQGEVRERGMLTLCRAQREGQVKPLRESERGEREGYSPTVECRQIRMQRESERGESEGYSPTVERRGRDKSGRSKEARVERAKDTRQLLSAKGETSQDREKAGDRGALTNCRTQREVQVRTQQARERGSLTSC